MTLDTIRTHANSLCPDLALAVEAAWEAGEILKRGYGQVRRIASKDAGDLVSQLDLDADRRIADVLLNSSELPILSEELSNTTPPHANLWIVDPLDASGAYLMRVGPHLPSVLIALRRDNEIILGLAYFPLMDEFYYAQKNRGAWHNGKRLICPDHEPLSQVWIEMNPYGNHCWETAFFRELRERMRSPDGARLVTCTAPNSGVAARIARGRDAPAAVIHDNNHEFPKQGPWDIAPVQLILEEAGGVFLNSSGHRTDPFKPEPIIVARSLELAQEVIERVHLMESQRGAVR